MLSFSSSESGQSGRLTLSGELGLERIGELKDTLLKSLSEVDYLEIDLEQVSDVSLAFLQIFCSAHRTALSHNKRLVVTGGPPEVLTRFVEDAGYNRHTGCGYDRDRSCLWLEGGSK